MKNLRRTYSRVIFVVLTEVVFINMGFVLAEIDTLGLTRQSALLQNLIDSGIEEEKECSSEVSDDAKEFYLLDNRTQPTYYFFLVAMDAQSSCDLAKPLSAYIAEFCPPPEFTLTLS
jgi:hypothetical protein